MEENFTLQAGDPDQISNLVCYYVKLTDTAVKIIDEFLSSQVADLMILHFCDTD